MIPQNIKRNNVVAIIIVLALLFHVAHQVGCLDEFDNSNTGYGTVSGTVTMPGPAEGKPYVVVLCSVDDPGCTHPDTNMSVCGTGTTFIYRFANVPLGTYSIVSSVYVNSSFLAPIMVSGDYNGSYGPVTVNNGDNLVCNFALGTIP